MLPFLIHRWFHVKHSLFPHSQHDLGDKYAVLTGKITCSAIFFTDAADGLDADAVGTAFGGLKYATFFLNFTLERVLHLNQEQMRKMRIDGKVNPPSVGGCFQAGFQSVFQEIGENETEVDLIHGKRRRNISSGLKRDAVSSCQCTVVTNDTVSGFIFAEMQIEIRDFTDCAGKVFFYFSQLSVLGKGRELKKMVAQIMPRLPGFIDGNAQVIIAGLLHGKKMIFLLKPCISVQTVGHKQKHGIEQDQNSKEYERDYNIPLQDSSSIQGTAVFWHHKTVQRDKDQWQDPEGIPGLCKIFILDHVSRGVGSRIPGEQHKKKRDEIVKKTGGRPEPQLVFCQMQRGGKEGVCGSGKAVDTGENGADCKENTARFPELNVERFVIKQHHEWQQQKEQRGSWKLQNKAQCAGKNADGKKHREEPGCKTERLLFQIRLYGKESKQDSRKNDGEFEHRTNQILHKRFPL